MSLTSEDLLQIRTVVSEVLQERLQPLEGRLEALENDIKAIYHMVSDLQRADKHSSFRKLSLERKLLKLNEELLLAAKQAGIRLPR